MFGKRYIGSTQPLELVKFQPSPLDISDLWEIIIPYTSVIDIMALHQTSNFIHHSIRKTKDWTQFYEICSKRQLEILAAKSDPNYERHRRSFSASHLKRYCDLYWVIREAASYGYIQTLRWLIDHGIHTNSMWEKDGRAIAFASMNGHLKCVQILYSEVKVNLTDDKVVTYLFDTDCSATKDQKNAILNWLSQQPDIKSRLRTEAGKILINRRF